MAEDVTHFTREEGHFQRGEVGRTFSNYNSEILRKIFLFYTEKGTLFYTEKGAYFKRRKVRILHGEGGLLITEKKLHILHGEEGLFCTEKMDTF